MIVVHVVKMTGLVVVINAVKVTGCGQCTVVKVTGFF